MRQEDSLACLWAQVLAMQKRKWREAVIVRAYAGFEEQFEQALQHTLPMVTIAPHVPQPGRAYPLPQVTFRIFDMNDTPEGPALPPTHTIERYLLEDAVEGILMAYRENFRTTAKMLCE